MKNNEGFTLIELMVAIFGVGMLGLFIYLLVLVVMALQKYVGG